MAIKIWKADVYWSIVAIRLSTLTIGWFEAVEELYLASLGNEAIKVPRSMYSLTQILARIFSITRLARDWN